MKEEIAYNFDNIKYMLDKLDSNLDSTSKKLCAELNEDLKKILVALRAHNFKINGTQTKLTLIKGE